MEHQEPQASKRNEPANFGAKLRRWFGLIWKALSLLVMVVVIVVALYAAIRFLPDRAVTHDTMLDHFKYGSTGGDRVTGIPVWIWQAMPLVCAEDLKRVAGDRLADDYGKRVAKYERGESAPANRRELSREGFKALGFIYEQNANGQERDLPIGVSQRRSLGMDRSYINCAICHTSKVRKDAKDPGTLVVGMPANLFNLYNFEHFIFQCGKNRRFSALEIVPEIQSLGGNLGLIDRYLVYPIAIEAVEFAIRFLEYVAGFSVRQPDWGPGRNDTFTNNKIFLYGEPWRDTMPDWWKTGKVDPQGIGIVDWPSIWLQGPRKKRSDGRPMQLHWDGNNDMVEERNLNAALATSALPGFIDHESIECIEQWLETFEPPKYEKFFPIDEALAKKGEPIYAKYCAECHGRDGRNFEGKYVGFATQIDEIGTDRHRLDNYTETLALNMATTYAEQKRNLRSHACPGGTTYQPPNRPVVAEPGPGGKRLAAVEKEEGSYRYKHYRKTNGYANMPLDGVWLRAPYLHNGSVPTLRDLLESSGPSGKRPPTFYRGNDLYDPKNVGFVSTEPKDANGRTYFFYDTTIPGNGNKGHEGRRYGTELAPEQKEALLEYLKTF
jgi:mono/diheme cytochrome c family protein